MVDTAQIVLLFVIVVLSVLLVVLGIQVYFILKELRKTITKANKVLDNAGEITKSVSDPIAKITSISSFIKGGSLVTAAKIIRSLISSDDEDKKTK